MTRPETFTMNPNTNFAQRIGRDLSLVSLALFVLMTFSACAKSPPPSTPTAEVSPPPAPIVVFSDQGKTYKSRDGRSVLTLVSATECELLQGRSNLLCKYTKEGGNLRVIVTALGTNQVVYFRFVEQGLVDNEGHVLFTEDALASLKRREEAERNRMATLKQAATRENVIRGEFAALPYKFAKFPAYPDSHVTPDRIVITDVSLKLHLQYTPYHKAVDYTVTVPFTNLSKVDDLKFEAITNNYYFDLKLRSQLPNLESGVIYGNTESETKTVRAAIVQSFEAWRAKFPELAK